MPLLQAGNVHAGSLDVQYQGHVDHLRSDFLLASYISFKDSPTFEDSHI